MLAINKRLNSSAKGPEIGKPACGCSGTMSEWGGEFLCNSNDRLTVLINYIF